MSKRKKKLYKIYKLYKEQIPISIFINGTGTGTY